MSRAVRAHTRDSPAPRGPARWCRGCPLPPGPLPSPPGPKVWRGKFVCRRRCGSGSRERRERRAGEQLPRAPTWGRREGGRACGGISPAAPAAAAPRRHRPAPRRRHLERRGRRRRHGRPGTFSADRPRGRAVCPGPRSVPGESPAPGAAPRGEARPQKLRRSRSPRCGTAPGCAPHTQQLFCGLPTPTHTPPPSSHTGNREFVARLQNKRKKKWAGILPVRFLAAE